MGNIQDFYITSSDNVKVAIRFYTADCDAAISDRVILIIHGLGEHGGRFEQLSNYFARHNFVSVTLDLRGNGRSEGKRGDTKKYEFLVNDVDIAIQKIRELYPCKQIIIYAHSFGCNIALNYCLKNKYKVDSLIMASPWLYDSRGMSFFYRLLYTTGLALFPGITFKTRVRGEQLSDNKQLLDQYRNDPLKHKKISLRLYYSANNMGRQAIKMISKVGIPALIMFGAKDSISNYCIFREAIENCPNDDELITVKTWEGAYHELHSWPNRDAVFEFTRNWIENTIN